MLAARTALRVSSGAVLVSAGAAVVLVWPTQPGPGEAPRSETPRARQVRESAEYAAGMAKMIRSWPRPPALRPAHERTFDDELDELHTDL